MSSQDDGSEGRQRTVAELLAQYGGGERDSDAPSGRRRRAEDATEETAPQAIIERVRADTDRAGPPPNGHAPTPHAPRSAPQPPPQGQAPPAPNPPAPNPQAPNPQGRTQQGPAQQGPPRQPQQPRPQPPQQAAQPPRGPQPPQQAGQPPQPGAQSQNQPQNQPQGSAVPARAPQDGQPQAKPQTRTAINPVVAPGQEQTQFAQPPEYDEQADPARYSPAPPIPDDVTTRSSVTARLAGTPPEPHTEMIQAVQDVDGPPSATETTGYYTPDFDDDDEAPGEQTGYHPGPLADGDDADDYLAGEPTQDGDDTGEHTDRDYTDRDYADEDDATGDYTDGDYTDGEADYEDEPRGAGEWMTLVGLIAAGVVGGGVLWLAFDWLWRTTKVGAAIAALVVILAIVFGVRKAWRARDVQTTVFAVIVGLIVTITPAALLYFGS